MGGPGDGASGMLSVLHTRKSQAKKNRLRRAVFFIRAQ